MICEHCERPIERGAVDYSDTPGWVHVHNGEALCDPDAEDGPDAEPATRQPETGPDQGAM